MTESETLPYKRNSKGRFVKGNKAWVGIRKKLSTRRKISKTLMGKYTGNKNPFWRGGVSIVNGYRMISRKNHPHADCRGYVYEHRLVLEEKLGRFLLPTEIAHHINGNKLDNRPENIVLVKNLSEHMKLHHGNRRAA